MSRPCCWQGHLHCDDEHKEQRGYTVPDGHIILHIRGGSVEEIEHATDVKDVVVEIWDHDECAQDADMRANCPVCRDA